MEQLASFLSFVFISKTPAVLAAPTIPPIPASFITAQSSSTGASRALDAVWQLSEVQRKAQEIQKRSNGRVRVNLIVEGELTQTEPYYTVQVYENHPERIVSIDRFRVASPRGTITVEEYLTGNYISLARWRPKNK